MMANTISITANEQNVTINATFTDANNFNRVKNIFIKTDGKTGTWTGHHSWLAEYLPKLQNRFIGNCIIISAPQGIIEKYELTITKNEDVAVNVDEVVSGTATIKRCAVCGSTFGLMNASTGIACPTHFDALS